MNLDSFNGALSRDGIEMSYKYETDRKIIES